jgi:molybdate/tungstate transport system permease protein
MFFRKSFFTWIFYILSGIILLFIIAPLAKLLLSGLFINNNLWYDDIELWLSIKRTLIVSFFATVFFSFGAIPFSYLLARKEFKFKKVILSIIDIPIVIPHTAAGIALLTILSPNTFFGKLLKYAGINIIDSYLGIAIAMAFVSIPFLIHSTYEGFKSIPLNIEKSALSLGMSPLKVFFKISVPLAWKNILTGFIMMFARGISEFGAIVVIAYYPMTSSVLLYERLNQFGLNYAQPMAAVIVLISFAVFIILRILSNKKE